MDTPPTEIVLDVVQIFQGLLIQVAIMPVDWWMGTHSNRGAEKSSSLCQECAYV